MSLSAKRPHASHPVASKFSGTIPWQTLVQWMQEDGVFTPVEAEHTV